MIWHLESVERLNVENIAPRYTINESLESSLLMTGKQSIESAPAVAAHLSWFDELKVMAHLDHLSGRVASSLGRGTFTSRANCLKMHWESRA